MKQLTQKLKNGEMKIIEVPVPLLKSGMILVKNHYSLISTGTEGSTVRAARKNLVIKAKERPQQVKQVINVVMQQGLTQAYRSVMKKLDSFSPLGYSSAGEVIEVASDVKRFSAGDPVACGGGGYASHAEIVSVPQNLCVKLSVGADLKKAAYNTLGAIALQGTRQADLKIGETCAVIGLGLIGQLTCLILRAGGIRTVGIDIDPEMVRLAKGHCTDVVLQRSDLGLSEKIDEFTDGIGCDSVIITAATDSLDPVNFAGRIAKKKGKVVIVGEVPTGFEREPYYYQKELELRMSCSYGPGRYDINYEEKGIDYPAGYVRWTENRNMQTFQELVHSRKIDMDYMTTHVFQLEDAPTAYDMIMIRNEPFLGVLIEYDISREHVKEKILMAPHSRPPIPNSVNIGFIGAGSYAMSHLLPNVARNDNVVLKGVMTSSGTSSRSVAEKYCFEFCTSDEDDIFKNQHINTVFIATRHDTHAAYVIKALKAGKKVYVEKPLCLNEGELNEILNIYNTLLSLSHSDPLLMVGFNRRFSSLTDILREKIGDGPASMIYRVNAGVIGADSWIQDESIGGGRIVGEVCHFIDYLTFINGSLPQSVFATALPDPHGSEDTVNISLKFRNGSIGTISYFANGAKSLFKEYVEVYRSGMTLVLRDFKELEVFGNGKISKKRFFSQDKGQGEMVRRFIDTIRKGEPPTISFKEIYTVTLSTLKILESIRTGRVITI